METSTSVKVEQPEIKPQDLGFFFVTINFNSIGDIARFATLLSVDEEVNIYLHLISEPMVKLLPYECNQLPRWRGRRETGFYFRTANAMHKAEAEATIAKLISDMRQVSLEERRHYQIATERPPDSGC